MNILRIGIRDVIINTRKGHKKEVKPKADISENYISTGDLNRQITLDSKRELQIRHNLGRNSKCS